jgi:hypothetical protein
MDQAQPSGGECRVDQDQAGDPVRRVGGAQGGDQPTE